MTTLTTMTQATFKAAVEAQVRERADRPVATITWTDGPREITFPTGVKGWYGEMTVTGTGTDTTTWRAWATMSTVLTVR